MGVSVVMAVHNEQATLARALASIVEQSDPDWELVAIDDASTDRTAEILREFAAADSRIRILRNRQNLGLAASLNIGWQAARHDLIARMDGDDWMFPERLERQQQFLRSHADVDVLGTAAELFDSQGTELGIARRPESHAELCGKIYRETPFIHPSVMMRRSFLERTGGYDASLRRSQDYDLWMRGRGEFRYHNLQEPLLRYCVRTKMKLTAMLYGTWVLSRGVWRDRAPLHNYVYPARFLAATSLTRLGLRQTRLR
ncbi:glycosyltransferase [Candidatus Laterigemmans baculatus]|uniref:glycosyltransferase n=1 Tax=Candidatus Laterigemmans baculatus TaxID=2770505 RepID=UPI0013DB9857|nr:glycosyltransferase [Candidatus Laterigemmans baculatus]